MIINGRHIRLLLRALKSKSKFRILSAVGIVIIGMIVGQNQGLEFLGSSTKQSSQKDFLSQSWPAQVLSVTDGDTIKVRVNGEQFKVRLYGIDAPEKAQRYGCQAHDFLTELIAISNGNIIIKPIDKDRYGRIVAILHTASNGHSLNEALIKAGIAWVYPQYCKIAVCRLWIASEVTAERNQVGLWAEGQPIAPWKWRKRR